MCNKIKYIYIYIIAQYIYFIRNSLLRRRYECVHLRACVCVGAFTWGALLLKRKRERREKTATLNRARKCHREKSALRRRARGRDDPFFGIQNQRAGKSRLVRCSARRVSNLNFEVLLPHTGRHYP